MGLFDGTPLQRPVTCGVCGAAAVACACPRDASGAVLPPGRQKPRVFRERRRGKWATVVTGLDPHANDLPALAGRLKTRFATGGTHTPDGVELQGDVRDRVVTLLRDDGFDVKASGG